MLCVTMVENTQTTKLEQKSLESNLQQEILICLEFYRTGCVRDRDFKRKNIKPLIF
jgi:hypothetical protein